jgi:hypothetical protein
VLENRHRSYQTGDILVITIGIYLAISMKKQLKQPRLEGIVKQNMILIHFLWNRNFV